MNGIQRIVFFFFTFVFFLFGMHASVLAANFQSDYDTQYAISPDGNTIVTQSITLTNKQSNLYPKQYTVIIDSTNIRNVIAYDKKGVITPKITTANKKTQLDISFNEQVVGFGKQLTFTLRYENGDIATKLGDIWEVHIPGITPDETLNTYAVSLQVPATFPQLAYLTPRPANGQKWTKDQLMNGGINAAYGQYQSFSVNATYNLENTESSPGIYEVTIPSDTAYQTVSVTSIAPKPKQMKRDDDGNWIAQFELAPGQRLDVDVQLFVKTFINAQRTSTQSATVSDVYLKSQRYWDTQDPQIQTIAKTHTTARAIYDYVVSTLSYRHLNGDEETIRKGAVSALKDPKNSVCTEFTDLFIAIARAAGIPAREIVGYAYTTDNTLRPLLANSDVLHAWPEYFDSEKKLWVPVDPTWGNTTGGVDFFDTMDFNHIAFVIHGVSSELPYPAGSYKQGTAPKKNVTVKIANGTKTTYKETFKTLFLIPNTVMAGKQMSGTIQVENIGTVKADTADIRIDAPDFSFHTAQQATDIPPYGNITIPISAKVPFMIQGGSAKITVSVNGEQFESVITIQPMYWLFVCGGVIFVCLISLIWIFFHKK